MTTNDFLRKLHESLELEDDVELTPDTNLKDLDDYDSLMVLSIISFMHENFGVRIPADTLAGVNTPRELMKLAGDEHFA